MSDPWEHQPTENLRARMIETTQELANEVREALLCAREHIETMQDITAERDALLPWAKLGHAVMEGWPELGDIDGFGLQDMAEAAGVLVAVPGGFDPEHHEDTIGVDVEPGDPWFEIIRAPAALKTPDVSGAVSGAADRGE